MGTYKAKDSKTVRVNLNFGRKWQLVICGKNYEIFIISSKTGVNADSSQKYIIVFY